MLSPLFERLIKSWAPRPRLAIAFYLALALGGSAALAQPMPPDHGGAASAPLFVGDLPVGTISVRITRPSMNEPIVDADVVGTWTAPNGKRASATVKTAADGRAVFSGVPAGATFSAKAEVGGEALATTEFAVPGEGGTRLLMIVGGGATEAMAGMTGHPGGRPATTTAATVATRGGKVEPRDGLPPGSVEILVLGADGTPIAGQRVELARAGKMGGDLQVKQAETDAKGVAHFAELPSGEDARWAAVAERDGLRVGSLPFALDPKRGSAGEMRIPGKTSELSVLRVTTDSRMMVELREDSIAVMQNLVIENTSDKIFDPGPRGLLVPLPTGCTGGEKLAGGAEVEMKEGEGAIRRGLFPPTDRPMAAVQVRVGCVMNTQQASEIEIVQPMPLGLQGGVAMIQALSNVGLSAPGIRARPLERDDQGSELRVYQLDSVAPGQPLRLIVHGLPARGQLGKWLTGLVAGLLVLAGIFALRKPRRAVTTPAAQDG